MKYKTLTVLFMAMFVVAGICYAAEDQSSVATQATTSQSLGAQAGESARKLKDAAEESYQTGAMKVGEASQKIQVQAQDAFRALQEQWNAFSKQFQEKAQAMSQQLQQQWQDFTASFNKPPKS